MRNRKNTEMAQRCFLESWLLPCSLRSHRTANPTPKNRLRHFSALPTHHPSVGGQWENLLILRKHSVRLCNIENF
jgi:hypothetical protein